MIWHLYLDVAIQLNLFLLYLFFIFPPIFFPPGNFILPSQRCMVFFFFLSSTFLLSFCLFPYSLIQFTRNPVDYAFEMYLELVITSSLQQIPVSLLTYILALPLLYLPHPVLKNRMVFLNINPLTSISSTASQCTCYKTNSNSSYKILFYVVPDCPTSSHVPIPPLTTNLLCQHLFCF